MEGPYDGSIRFLRSVDRTIHEPARFMIVAHLYVLESVDFVFLLGITGLTEGNLSSHLRKLEEVGYLRLKKGFKGRRPHTMITLTKEGRAAYRKYHDLMKGFFSDGP